MPPKFVRNPDSTDIARSKAAERVSLLESGDSEEDFFLSGPKVKTDNLFDPKVDRLQNQVGEVIDVMKNNVTKVLERGERLEDLQDKSDDLANHSDMFRSRAGELRKRMWWQNCRARIIIAVVVVLILAIIIVPIIIQEQK